MTAMSNSIAPVSVKELVSHGLRRDEDGWEHYSYTVTLSCGDESMMVPWRQGTGITEEPTAADVLESLLSDAAGFLNARSFEEWASDYGYDTDSRKTEAIYRATEEQTEQLLDLLGEEFDAAVFPQNVEDGPDDVAKRLTSS